MKRSAILIALSLSSCSVEQQVADHRRQVLAPFKARFCAMSEAQKHAFLLKRLQIANASGGYVR